MGQHQTYIIQRFTTEYYVCNQLLDKVTIFEGKFRYIVAEAPNESKTVKLIKIG